MGAADLQIHDELGVVVKLLDVQALLFGIACAGRAHLHGYGLALQVVDRRDAAAVGSEDNQLRFVEGSGEEDVLSPFLGHRHTGGGNIHIALLDDRNDAGEGKVIDLDFPAHFLADGLNQIHFKALVIFRIRFVLKLEGHKGSVRSDAERFLLFSSRLILAAAAGDHRRGHHAGQGCNNVFCKFHIVHPLSNLKYI